MGDHDDASATGDDRRRRPWLAVGAAVLALVVGLAVGYLVGGGTGRESSVASVESSPETVPPTTAPAPQGSGTSQSCQAAGVAARQVIEELEAAVPAVGALDAGALRQILDRLRPLQDELDSAVAACEGGLVPPAPGPTG
jgi:hypothetical protein